jgi:hypothetical protein
MKKDLGLQSEILVPLPVESPLRGVVLAFSSARHHFTEEDLRCVQRASGLPPSNRNLNLTLIEEDLGGMGLCQLSFCIGCSTQIDSVKNSIAEIDPTQIRIAQIGRAQVRSAQFVCQSVVSLRFVP